jgi:hypothetical protein
MILIRAVRRFGDPRPVDAIAATELRAWLLELRSSLAPESVAGYVRGLKAFGNWCVAEELAAAPGFRALRRPHVTRRLIAPFSDAEPRSLLALADERERALVLLLLDTGLRLSERASLRVGDVRPDGTLHVMGKGAKERIVPMVTTAREALVRYLGTRARATVTDPLFTGRQGALSRRATRSRRTLGILTSRPGRGRWWLNGPLVSIGCRDRGAMHPLDRARGADEGGEMGRTAFEDWAALLFLALTVLGVLVGLAMVAGPVELPPGARLVALAGLPFGTVALVVAAVGLRAARRWAHPASVALLAVLVISGAVRFVASLQTGITIPIEAIAAALVLRLPRDPERVRLAARDRWLVGSLAALYLMASIWPAVTDAALRPGASPFAVAEDALDLSLALDCGEATGDRRIRATVTWMWRERDLFPGSTDGLVLRWFPTTEIPAPYYDFGASSWPDAAWPGMGSPAATLIEPLLYGGPVGRSTTFGIDVAGHGQVDGTVVAILRPSDAQPHGSLRLDAAYAHLDRWVRASPALSCSW